MQIQTHIHKAGCGDAYVCPSIGEYRETGRSQGSLVSQASLNAQYPGLEKDHFPKKKNEVEKLAKWFGGYKHFPSKPDYLSGQTSLEVT